MVPPWRRGLGPRPQTSFKYQLRNIVPTNLCESSIGDNLVPKDSGFASDAMSSQFGTGSGIAIEEALKAIHAVPGRH
jgi:hypothetical protein